MTRTPNTRTYWDYTFQWTDLHQTSEQLRPQMFTYDKLVDECLERLEELAPAKQAIHPESTVPVEGAPKLPKRDLYTLVRHHAKDDPKIARLWEEINTVPEWVDWDQIKRGQEVFFRYGMPMLNVVCPCLVLLSLTSRTDMVCSSVSKAFWVECKSPSYAVQELQLITPPGAPLVLWRRSLGLAASPQTSCAVVSLKLSNTLFKFPCPWSR